MQVLTFSSVGGTPVTEIDVSGDGTSAAKNIKDAIMQGILADQPTLKIKFATTTKGGVAQKSSTVSALTK
jgi:hypothetical protein